MDSCYVPWLFAMGVSPFGNLRIKAYLQLPAAYRSLSRPSSAPDAKAFPLCSYSLELSIDLTVYLAVLLNCLSFINKFFGIHIAVKGFILCYTIESFHLAVKLYLPIFSGKTKFF